LNPLTLARYSFARCTTARVLSAVAAAALLTSGAIVRAESPPAAAQPPEAAQKLYGEYMQLQGRLDQIQTATLDAHPELKQQQQSFMDLMMAKMPSTGGSAKDDLAAIEKIEKDLSNKDTPAADREALMTEYQQKATAFRKAQAQALKDAEVAKAQETLMNAILTAMKAQDPQTEQILGQMRQKQEELTKVMGAAHGGQ